MFGGKILRPSHHFITLTQKITIFLKNDQIFTIFTQFMTVCPIFTGVSPPKNLPNLDFKLVRTICSSSIAFLVKLLHSLILKNNLYWCSQRLVVTRGHSGSFAVTCGHLWSHAVQFVNL